MGTVFNVEALKVIRRVLKKNISHVIALLIFYEHIKFVIQDVGFHNLLHNLLLYLSRLSVLIARKYLQMIIHFRTPPSVIFVALGFLRY